MSTILDDIWDEPLTKEPSPPRNATPAADEADDSGDDMFRPSKRRRSSLFLDDPDEIEEPAMKEQETAAGASESSRPDIDALFEEVEENDGGASSRPFDIEAYRREAQRRAEKEVNAPSSSYPQHAVRSSSPPIGGADGDKDEGDEDETEKKGRRKVPKIDDARLLGKDGLPALVRQVRAFKPKGKGHEQADLNKLMSLYQFWSHKMMPKWTFSDTVNRVEKVCRSKRMTVALSTWKDEFNGTIHGNKVGDDDSENESGDEKDEANAKEGAEQPSTSSPTRSRAPSSAPSSASQPPTRPPSSASGSLFLEDDNDLFDFQGVSGGDSSSRANSSNTEPVTDVDESDMWAELDGDPDAFDDPPPPASNSRTAGIKLKPAKVVNEDDEMWGILDDMDMDQPPPTKSLAPAPVTQEADFSAQPIVAHESNQVPIAPAAAPRIVDDPDWDDMYE